MLTLTVEEIESALWKKIRTHMEERRALHMGKNNTSLPIAETEKLRGRTAECDYILGLDKPVPEFEPEDSALE